MSTEIIAGVHRDEINDRDLDGNTALHIAVFEGRTADVQALLPLSDANIKNKTAARPSRKPWRTKILRSRLF